jgi:hypothetical protein
MTFTVTVTAPPRATCVRSTVTLVVHPLVVVGALVVVVGFIVVVVVVA